MNLAPGSDQEIVRLRAFRGSRRASVYREHDLPRASARRLAEAASAQRLPLMGALDPGGLLGLDKDAARRLAREAEALASLPALSELADDLAAIAEVARWCGRSSKDAWLTITSL